MQSQGSYETVKTNNWELEFRKQELVRQKQEFMATHSSGNFIAKALQLTKAKAKFMRQLSPERMKEKEEAESLENEK